MRNIGLILFTLVSSIYSFAMEVQLSHAVFQGKNQQPYTEVYLWIPAWNWQGRPGIFGMDTCTDVRNWWWLKNQCCGKMTISWRTQRKIVPLIVRYTWDSQSTAVDIIPDKMSRASSMMRFAEIYT